MMSKHKYITTNEKQALDELIQYLKEEFGNKLEQIKLFGSKLRGDFDKASDIDLFLVFNNKVDWRFKDKIYEIIFEINLKYEVFLSARIYSSSRLKESKIKTLPFIKNVVEQGIDLL
jgi:predicted nucleotidyltransferase